MRSLILITALCMIGMTVFSFSPPAGEDGVEKQQTVPDVDLERYSGLWYEIARFPHSFEKGLVGVTAEYILKPGGRVTVINRGYRVSFDGRVSTVRGRAQVPDPAEPGRLKVAFFLFFGADYRILDLDRKAEDYRWAIVGSSSDNYLWILSREPIMEEELYRDLVRRAAALGYDTSRLIRVEQREEK